jgi:hypothetical protein
MGILANHAASVEALRPGVVEVIEENGSQGKKWFGMSIVHSPNPPSCSCKQWAFGGRWRKGGSIPMPVVTVHETQS